MPHTKPILSPSKPSALVSWRSIAIGVLLIPINCYWITYIELVQYSAQPTIVSLIFTVVFNVLVLIGLNQVFKRFLPQLALSQGELLVIYVMLSVASATAGHSMMEILVSTLGHAFWFATPENDWKDLFWRYIPRMACCCGQGRAFGLLRGRFYAVHKTTSVGLANTCAELVRLSFRDAVCYGLYHCHRTKTVDGR